MKTITHSQLVDLLANRAGTTFIGIDSLTDTQARKKGNPFPDSLILKQSRFVGTVGADYENAVNREGERQGIKTDFQAQSLPWGQWEIPGKVISHNGERYLRTQTVPRQRKARPAHVVYRDKAGQFLSPDSVKPFIPAKAPSKRQAETGLDGEENQIQPKNFKLSSLLRVRVNGQTFKVVPDHGAIPPVKPAGRSGTPYNERKGTVGSVAELETILRKQEPIAALVMGKDLQRRANRQTYHLELKDTQWHDDDWCESQND